MCNAMDAGVQKRIDTSSRFYLFDRAMPCNCTPPQPSLPRLRTRSTHVKRPRSNKNEPWDHPETTIQLIDDHLGNFKGPFHMHIRTPRACAQCTIYPFHPSVTRPASSPPPFYLLVPIPRFPIQQLFAHSFPFTCCVLFQ